MVMHATVRPMNDNDMVQRVDAGPGLRVLAMVRTGMAVPALSAFNCVASHAQPIAPW